MKKLVCELCGSGDMIKKDGYYICQACETKYSVEEAKKMMIEGTVDVSGSTIKVDNTSYIEKSLDNARQALKREDWAKVAKYYTSVQSAEPDNLEAIFYSAYGEVRASMYEADKYKRESKVNILVNSLSEFVDKFDYAPDKYASNKKLLIRINNDLNRFYNAQYVYTKTTTANSQTDDSWYTEALIKNTSNAFASTINRIINKIEQSNVKHYNLIYLYEILRNQYLFLFSKTNSYEQEEEFINKIKNVDFKLKEIDSTYNAKPLPAHVFIKQDPMAFAKIFLIMIICIIIGVSLTLIPH